MSFGFNCNFANNSNRCINRGIYCDSTVVVNYPTYSILDFKQEKILPHSSEAPIKNSFSKDSPQNKIEASISSLSETAGVAQQKTLASVEKPSICGWARSGNWKKMDDYASEGGALFFLETKYFTPSIEFIDASLLRRTINGGQYLPFSHIKKALHDFVDHCIETKLGFDFSVAVELYVDNNDEEGLRSLFNKWPMQFSLLKESPKYFLSWSKGVILRKQNQILSILLDCLPSSEQKVLFDFTHQIGYVEAQQVIYSKGCLDEIERKQIENQKDWFEGEVENQFPALKSYKSFDRTLNPLHKACYGKGNAQEIYQQETRKNVEYALWMLNEGKKSGFNGEWSTIFLESLGKRRESIAHLNKTEDAGLFGLKRIKTSGSDSTPLLEQYESYGLRMNKQGPHKITLIIDDKEYTICEVRKYDGWNSLLKGEWEVYHCYFDFFKENDPVFKHVAAQFKNIMETEYVTDEELKNDIAAFHWVFANVVPFWRGSAAIAEVITDALWLYHGYVPRGVEKGTSLDLEAMMSPKVESFQKIYPTGIKVNT